MKSAKATDKAVLLETSDDMVYTLGLYLYPLVAGVVAVVCAEWLSPLGLTVNIIFAVVVAYLGNRGGRCVLRRKSL